MYRVIPNTRISNYNFDCYIEDIKKYNFEDVWSDICSYLVSHRESNFLNVDDLSDMYEIGLAIKDKNSKKRNGQYYTPNDVASVMARWLDESEGANICDVGCGTGRLIIAFLEFIGEERAIKLLESGKIYLYDTDKVALNICRTLITIKYGDKSKIKININNGDFLDKNILLPEDAKVISNPPYGKIYNINQNWNNTEIQKDTKELFASFIEKIFTQAKSSVIITPFSFISGDRFYSLRKMMCRVGYGSIISFDNIPGNIFHGYKRGIFNSNTANSVRAAITIFSASEHKKGFRVSPLIRFKNSERECLLKTNILESTLPNRYQIISAKNRVFSKIDKNLESVFESWSGRSEQKLGELISAKTGFMIDMPNTCRYFTVASNRKLNRKGSNLLFVEDKNLFNFIFCFLNSSFAYWWWRIYDGGIIYSKKLLLELPIPYSLLSEEDKNFFSKKASEMIGESHKYIVNKKNAGVFQENIKYPEKYRNSINERIIKILGCKEDNYLEDIKKIHNNFFVDRGEDER